MCCFTENPDIESKPVDVDCLKVKKVFEECSRTFVAKVKIPINPPHHGKEVECGRVKVNPKELECEILPECSKIEIVENEVTLHIHAFLVNEGHKHRVEAHGELIIPEKDRKFFLSRAGEEDLECEVEIFAECLECFISCKSHEDMVSEITCCVGILIIAKLVSDVQLLIPTFGYCPVPPKCKPDHECPKDYNPTAIPFPPQPTKTPKPTKTPTPKPTSKPIPKTTCAPMCETFRCECPDMDEFLL